MILLLFIFSITIQTHSKPYFDSKISYFDEVKKEIPKKKANKQTKKDGFSWAEQMDPNNDEFFKEGNYMPPKAYIEAIRNPSDENVKNYLSYMGKKQKLLEAFKNKVANLSQTKKVNVHLQDQPQISNFDQKVLFFHDIDCPFCKKMYPEINQALNSGVFVEAIRVDKKREQTKGLIIPSRRITKKERAKYKIEAVPALLVVNKKNKKILKYSGYKNFKEIINILKSGEI